MKRFFCLLALMVVFLVFPISAVGADAKKFGVVDLQRCITESVEGKRIFESLKKKKDAMQAKLDKKQEDLRDAKEELDKQSMMLSMDAKEDKEKDFERKRREFKFLYEDLTDEMREAENDARKKILEELEKLVMDIGKKGKYLLIFERRSSGIMSLDKAIDITDEVIKAYDKKKP